MRISGVYRGEIGESIKVLTAEYSCCQELELNKSKFEVNQDTGKVFRGDNYIEPLAHNSHNTLSVFLREEEELSLSPAAQERISSFNPWMKLEILHFLVY